MKNKICLLLSLVAIGSLQAQEIPSVVKSQFKINVLVPGFVYEHGFDTKNTLYSEVSVGVGYRSNDFSGERWDFYPVINEQFRHYYNLEKRAKKGKVTSHNSGGYYALTGSYVFQSIATKNDYYNKTIPSLTVGPVWGFERTYSRKFNLGLNLGLGVNIDKYDTEVVPILNFSLGWVLGK